MNKFAALTAVASAVAGLGLAHLYLNRLEAEISGGPPVAVLVAATDIPVGAPLTEEQVAVRTLPSGYVEDRHIRASEVKEILGARTAGGLKASEAVLWTDLAQYSDRARTLSGLVQSGMRAVAIASQSSDLEPLLQPGDHVDILLTTTSAGGEAATVTLLQNLLVLSRGGVIDNAENIGPSERRLRASFRGGVTVSATAEQAQIITQAKERGRLSLTLRNPEDIALVEGMPHTTAQDVFGAKDRLDWRQSRPAKTQEGIEHVR